MKPSISIDDERGAVLHVTDDDGHGVAVPLNRESLERLGVQCAAALEAFQGPGKGKAWWRVARAVVRTLGDLADGRPDAERDREADR